ncbi:hypothetical protein DFJ77DRAFT_466065 [Powellomyces hirtus]|nr:hypothetical protein DFJ77DRAFT_466065 [Powellomyces hirtus]
MPMQFPLKIWQLARDVAAKGPLADPRRLGLIPHDLKPHRRIIPTFLHGKRITFGDNISDKGSNRTRRAYLPNVIYHSLYSRALDMNIWCRLSAHALREIDAAGGFDEYVLRVDTKYLNDCRVAQMYKRRIADVMDRGKRDALRGDMEKLVAEKYGPEYLDQLKQSHALFDKAVDKRRPVV